MPPLEVDTRDCVVRPTGPRLNYNSQSVVGRADPAGTPLHQSLRDRSTATVRGTVQVTTAPTVPTGAPPPELGRCHMEKVTAAVAMSAAPAACRNVTCLLYTSDAADE